MKHFQNISAFLGLRVTLMTMFLVLLRFDLDVQTGRVILVERIDHERINGSNLTSRLESGMSLLLWHITVHALEKSKFFTIPLAFIAFDYRMLSEGIVEQTPSSSSSFSSIEKWRLFHN